MAWSSELQSVKLVSVTWLLMGGGLVRELLLVLLEQAARTATAARSKGRLRGRGRILWALLRQGETSRRKTANGHSWAKPLVGRGLYPKLRPEGETGFQHHRHFCLCLQSGPG